MNSGVRLLALVVALIVAALLADPMADFLARDACLDAGGRYDATTGACTSLEGYVPPFSRSDNAGFWLVFLAPIVGVAAATYAVVSRLLNQAR